MKRIVCGILAHVDSGKTTLSEALLYMGGAIRKAGRVDKKDAFLDHNAVERDRGITVFSKQAILQTKELRLTLIDTPGHTDFSAEAERALWVLDHAILIVSAPDGVQAHTETLWKLLARYRIPTFIFVNKTDQPCPEKEAVMRQIRERLSGACVDFSDPDSDDFYEQTALCSEQMLERYLAEGALSDAQIAGMIAERKLFPCFFGSALHMDGVRELLDGFTRFAAEPTYGEAFAARVFKIARDDKNERLTYLKVTGGSLGVRDAVVYQSGNEVYEEKINQIRMYSGAKYETAACAQAGDVCAVTGLAHVRAGEGLGVEKQTVQPLLMPVMTYRMILPDDLDAVQFLPKLKQIEEEEPLLHIAWNEKTAEISVQLMGEIQIEILERMIRERFLVTVHFGPGNIVYWETLAEPVYGIGHYEPLRHYAEVQLYMEPGERGSGLTFASACSEDVLDRNWQRLILTHLAEKEHLGVLAGYPITDIKITLLAGRAHTKHTEGGDFRQATYRAVRQGLRSARCLLLEPYYHFRITVPTAQIGRVMSDMERRHAEFSQPLAVGERMELEGIVAVSEFADYAKELAEFTKGQGELALGLHGYEPCRNTEKVVETLAYDPDTDEENPCGSVFCTHGGGFYVPWDKVKEYMHLPLCERGRGNADGSAGSENAEPPESGALRGYGMGGASGAARPQGMSASDFHQRQETVLGTEEIDAILAKSVSANKKEKQPPAKPVQRESRDYKVSGKATGMQAKEEYLLVDGYNVIFAWEDLKDLAAASVDGARGKLLDILCNYQAMRGCELIVVFDAYRVQGHAQEISDYHNIHVVFTKEAETADQFIEKFAHQNSGKYRITVATSDALEQIIIRGEGCYLLSSRDLKREIEELSHSFSEQYMEKSKKLSNTPEEKLAALSKEYPK